MRKGVWYGLLTVWYGLLTSLALLLAACGGQPPTGLTLARRRRPRGDFTLSLNPTSLSVQQGSNGQTTLTVTPQNGFTGTVNLAWWRGRTRYLRGSPSPLERPGFGHEPCEPVPDPLRPAHHAHGHLPPQGAGHLGEPHPGGGPDGHGHAPGGGGSPDFTLSLNPTSLRSSRGLRPPPR
jgi:hypothetical protein